MINRTGNRRFEATIKSDQVQLQASAPTKWFRLLLKIILILLIALLILKVPELWQAIQTAIGALPK